MLADTINNGLNNPDCAFFVGTFFGQAITIKLILVGIAMYFIFKVVDTFAFEPTMKWIKQEVGKFVHKKPNKKI